MLMKTCFKCGQNKSVDEFYVHPQMGDGHLGKCKECTKRDAKEHRTSNIERVMAYDKRRNRLAPRRVNKLAYQQKSRASYPERHRARALVGAAIRSGKLKRLACEVCGSKAEAHHDDYSKPLEVKWLCFKHHRELHGNQFFQAA